MAENKKTLDKSQLLAAIDAAESIGDLFALVQREAVDIRMRSFSSASNLPPKLFDMNDTETSPLEKLKLAVKLAVYNSR